MKQEKKISRANVGKERSLPVWNKGLTKSDPRVAKTALAKVGKKRLDITGGSHPNWKGGSNTYKERARQYDIKRKDNLQRKANVAKWAKIRRKEDYRFRLDWNIKSAISGSLKGKKSWRKWESLVGYDIDTLMIHLEKQFDDMMRWDNYGSYWHIDHIKPRSLFNYENAEDEEFKMCWVLNNLQPLEKIANIKKGNNYVAEKLAVSIDTPLKEIL